MTYSVYAIANGFIDLHLSGQICNLSPMKLQRLVYLANHWHIRVLDKPLIDDHFCRWEYGPVVPCLYHKLKSFGYANVTKMIHVSGIETLRVPVIADTNDRELLYAVTRKYGSMNSSELTHITTLQNSAWSIKPNDGSVMQTSEIKSDVTII